MKLDLLYHYATDDPQFLSDVHAVTLRIPYDDGAQTAMVYENEALLGRRADAFVDGARAIRPDIEVEVFQKADIAL